MCLNHFMFKHEKLSDIFPKKQERSFNGQERKRVKLYKKSQKWKSALRMDEKNYVPVNLFNMQYALVISLSLWRKLIIISCWWIIEHFMLNAEWLSSSLLCLAKLHQAKSRNCDNTLTLRWKLIQLSEILNATTRAVSRKWRSFQNGAKHL